MLPELVRYDSSGQATAVIVVFGIGSGLGGVFGGLVGQRVYNRRKRVRATSIHSNPLSSLHHDSSISRAELANRPRFMHDIWDPPDASDSESPGGVLLIVVTHRVLVWFALTCMSLLTDARGRLGSNVRFRPAGWNSH